MPMAEKYTEIYLELQKRIQQGYYIDRLPSRRVLMQEFQCSSRTMHKVFLELKFSGLIETTAQCTQIKPDQIRQQPRVLLCAPYPCEKLQRDPTIQRLKELIAESGFELVWCFTDQESVEDKVRDLNFTSFDGVIFTNSSFARDLAGGLEKMHIPFVSGNRPSQESNINWVDWNHLELFDDILGELVSCGARNIDFFIPVSSRSIHEGNYYQVMEDFRAVKKSYLLYNPELDCADNTLRSIEEYADFITGLKHLPDAVCLSHTECTELAEELEKRSIDPDFLVSIGGQEHKKASCFYSTPARRKLGEKIWKLFLYTRYHANAPVQGIKQHCEVKFSKEFRKKYFNTIKIKQHKNI